MSITSKPLSTSRSAAGAKSSGSAPINCPPVGCSSSATCKKCRFLPPRLQLHDELVEHHFAQRVRRTQPPRDHAHRHVAVARQRGLNDRKIQPQRADRKFAKLGKSCRRFCSALFHRVNRIAQARHRFHAIRRRPFRSHRRRCSASTAARSPILPQCPCTRAAHERLVVVQAANQVLESPPASADFPARSPRCATSPRRRGRHSGVCRNRSRNAASSSSNNPIKSIGLLSARGANSACRLSGAREFQGQTS